MKNFFPLIIILIIASTICSSKEEKTKKDESSYIFNSLINCATNFYSNYLESTVKFVSCPLGSKGCEIAANIQITSEGLKTAGIGQEAGAKILEKVIDITSKEAITGVGKEAGAKIIEKVIDKTSTEAINGMAKEAGTKILEKVIDKSSTEAIKEVAGKKAEEVVYKWGTKKSFSFFKIIPAISSGYSFYNAYNKFKNGDNLGGSLYVTEGIIGWIPGLSYASLVPSVLNTIKEVSEVKSDK